MRADCSGATETLALRPDDSDLMEYTHLDARALADTPPLVPRAAAAPHPTLVHGLIPVSNRFWFAVFSQETLPCADTLNAEGGMAHAAFPSDMPSSVLPSKLHWFCVDEDLVYLSFSNDWGPLNIAMFYRFCVHVHQMLIDEEMASMHLCLYTSTHAHHKANAALLCALYAMTIDHISPADAFYPYSELELMPFRDAGYGRADFSLTMQDILYGMRRALDHQLLDLTTFDLEEYEHYEQVQNGDWNWITPQFLAFASPKDKAYMAMLAASGGQPCAVPHTTAKPTGLLRSTIDYFRDRKVGLVVRLNNPLYNRKAFEAAGIAHMDMYFDDGSNPSDEIVRAFITEADRVLAQGQAIAVHCKAGLGRTGVLIGAYLIWKYNFTANEVIGYMRMMRPGCVVGPQQHYMYERAALWVRWGVEHRLRAELCNTVPQTPSTKRTQVSPTPSTAPRTKPTPCVGQPRKSPSPKRRRVGALGASTDSPSSGEEEAEAERAPPSLPEAPPGCDEQDARVVEQLTERVRTDEEVLGVLPSCATPTGPARRTARSPEPTPAPPMERAATSPERPGARPTARPIARPAPSSERSVRAATVAPERPAAARSRAARVERPAARSAAPSPVRAAPRPGVRAERPTSPRPATTGTTGTTGTRVRRVMAPAQPTPAALSPGKPRAVRREGENVPPRAQVVGRSRP